MNNKKDRPFLIALIATCVSMLAGAFCMFSMMVG